MVDQLYCPVDPQGQLRIEFIRKSTKAAMLALLETMDHSTSWSQLSVQGWRVLPVRLEASDPVTPVLQQALEQATRASFNHEGADYTPPLHVWQDRRWRMAHSLDAFLKALPSVMGVDDRGAQFWGQCPPGEDHFLWLAAKIKEAAGAGPPTEQSKTQA